MRRTAPVRSNQSRGADIFPLGTWKLLKPIPMRPQSQRRVGDAVSRARTLNVNSRGTPGNGVCTYVACAYTRLLGSGQWITPDRPQVRNRYLRPRPGAAPGSASGALRTGHRRRNIRAASPMIALPLPKQARGEVPRGQPPEQPLALGLVKRGQAGNRSETRCKRRRRTCPVTGPEGLRTSIVTAGEKIFLPPICSARTVEIPGRRRTPYTAIVYVDAIPSHHPCAGAERNQPNGGASPSPPTGYDRFVFAKSNNC